jgi:glycosyltransferase involved in cell wall biosynthesis
MMAKKPLSVLHPIPSMDQGGAERILASLVANAGAEFDHTIVTLLAGEPFFPITPEKLLTLGLAERSLTLRPFCRLRRVVTQRKPSVLHAWLYHGNFASTAAAGLGIPIIWSIHNTTLSAKHSKRITRAINRMSAVLSHSIPTRIVYASERARTLHEQLGYSEKRGLVIRNGIEMAPFQFDTQHRGVLRAELGIKDNEFAVGCVARFDPQKNQELIIKAFARLSAHLAGKLVLVGRDCIAENGQLCGWLLRAGVADRAVLMGQRSDVPAVMSALDVLVIGSSYGEAAPVVALEAAASGLPLVSTDVGLGATEPTETAALVLSPCHIVPVEDPERMAQALVDVHARFDAACRSERAASRRALLADYSFERMRAQYDELYSSVADETRRNTYSSQ